MLLWKDLVASHNQAILNSIGDNEQANVLSLFQL